MILKNILPLSIFQHYKKLDNQIKFMTIFNKLKMSIVTFALYIKEYRKNTI